MVAPTMLKIYIFPTTTMKKSMKNVFVYSSASQTCEV